MMLGTAQPCSMSHSVDESERRGGLSLPGDPPPYSKRRKIKECGQNQKMKTMEWIKNKTNTPKATDQRRGGKCIRDEKEEKSRHVS